MPFKKMTAALAALSLTTSPVLAQSTATEETSTESGLEGAGPYLGALVGIVILATVFVLLFDEKEESESP